MTSKEALEKISWRYVMDPSFQEWCNTIEQDLDRLETFDYIAEQNVELREENLKLKQLIEKIKELPNCNICDANWHEGCMCLKRKIEEVLGNETNSN